MLEKLVSFCWLYTLF